MSSDLMRSTYWKQTIAFAISVLGCCVIWFHLKHYVEGSVGGGGLGGDGRISPFVIVETMLVPANLSLYFWWGSPTVAIPIKVSMSHSDSWILLRSRINVLSRVGRFPLFVVTFRYMICFPMVVPRVDSRNAAYRKSRTPCRKSDALVKNGMGHVVQVGNHISSEIIHVIIAMIMLSIIAAMSLRSQWSWRRRSVPILPNTVDVADSPLHVLSSLFI